MTPQDQGLRARNKADKSERIFEAAASLFAEHGFDAVTTQQIAQRADVAAGTVFRYAATKGALLLMVYNREFDKALRAGERAAQRHSGGADGVIALTTPLLSSAARHPANSLHYQREVLFGAPEEPHRLDALAMVQRFEALVAQQLLEPAPSRTELDTARAEDAARAVFALVHLAVVSAAASTAARRVASATLTRQIGQVVAGFASGV